jgi:hypothetical protein
MLIREVIEVAGCSPGKGVFETITLNLHEVGARGFAFHALLGLADLLIATVEVDSHVTNHSTTDGGLVLPAHGRAFGCKSSREAGCEEHSGGSELEHGEM